MGTFSDRLLVQLSDATDAHQQLRTLLMPSPPVDVPPRLRILLNAMYDLAFADLRRVMSLQIAHVEAQRPLFPTRHLRGMWTQTMPAYTRTDIVENQVALVTPLWLDLVVEVQLVLALQIDPVGLELVFQRQLDTFATLAEVEEHFKLVDMKATLQRFQVESLDELREQARTIMFELRGKAPADGPFDPENPANQRQYRLDLAILLRETLDVVGALRDARLVREILGRTSTFSDETPDGSVRAPYVPVLIFPRSVLPGDPAGADSLQAFFAAEGVLAIFEPEPA
jgi:hypothetical protein